MITVGIKELKARLSRYVDEAKNGEEIIVTEHGREVALLVPITPERKAVLALCDSGKVRWSGGKPKGVTGVEVQGEPLAETVLQERR